MDLDVKCDRACILACLVVELLIVTVKKQISK